MTQRASARPRPVEGEYCTASSKRCFTSRGHARRAMRRLKATLRVYRCQACWLFHFASKRRGE